MKERERGTRGPMCEGSECSSPQQHAQSAYTIMHKLLECLHRQRLEGMGRSRSDVYATNETVLQAVTRITQALLMRSTEGFYDLLLLYSYSRWQWQWPWPWQAGSEVSASRNPLVPGERYRRASGKGHWPNADCLGEERARCKWLCPLGAGGKARKV